MEDLSIDVKKVVTEESKGIKKEKKIINYFCQI